MGHRQVVRHQILILTFGGSNPAIPDWVRFNDGNERSMSQKLNPRSLRQNYWLDSNQSWFTEQKYAMLLNMQWWLHRWSLLTFSKMSLFRVKKSVSRRRKKKSNYVFSTAITRPIKSKIYVSPVLMPFPQKGYLRKYMPIKAMKKKFKTLNFQKSNGLYLSLIQIY